ncbi:hypothetical protein [Aeoliella sp. SH292]|uniref:hypothetical protein n=1 Tax=Aeoliella sp. SH292 TaxID=3454464 RepID=UPI003F98867C
MSYDLGPSHQRLTSWLLHAWSGTSCGLHAAGPPRLMPTCFGVLAAECNGQLGKFSEERRDAVADYILGHQQSDTGLFVDGLVEKSHISLHTPRYIYLQHTYFALHALDALAREPNHPVYWSERMKSLEYMRGWFDGGPWHSPWLHSNHFMFILTFLQQLHEREGDQDALSTFDAILDYLDARQDPQTGTWQPECWRDDQHAIFAGYHFLPYYFWRGRRPPFVEQQIDTTLGIQSADGFYLPGGGACEDLDAVHTLVMMAMISDHRADDVKQSLLRCARAILTHQNADGGFSNYSIRREGLASRWMRRTNADQVFLRRNLVKRTWNYSSWKPLACPLDASDMWSAWFRPLSLILIADLYPSDFTGQWTPTYRRIPGLGWHDPVAIRGAVPTGNQGG